MYIGIITIICKYINFVKNLKLNEFCLKFFEIKYTNQIYPSYKNLGRLLPNKKFKSTNKKIIKIGNLYFNNFLLYMNGKRRINGP